MPRRPAAPDPRRLLQWVTSFDTLREALPRWSVAMIGSGEGGFGWFREGEAWRGWVGGDPCLRGQSRKGREGRAAPGLEAARQCTARRAPPCTAPPRPAPPAPHAGAWACTAAKLIAENLRSPEHASKYERTLRMYVWEEEFEGR